MSASTTPPVRLTPDRMQEPKAPGCCSWPSWERLPAGVQWTFALLESREAKLFGEPCPIENMQDRPT